MGAKELNKKLLENFPQQGNHLIIQQIGKKE